MVDRLPVVLRTDTTPARLQEMPAADLLPKSILANALGRPDHTGPLNWAWAIYGGTANAVTLAPAFARTAYTTGDEFRFRATATNTGATTINVGGLGAKTAVTVTGAAVPAGYIRTDVDTVCVYDGTKFVVQRDVETGENANGRFTRYADGKLECLIYTQGYPAGTKTVALPAVAVVPSATPWGGVSIGVVPYGGWDTDVTGYADATTLTIYSKTAFTANWVIATAFLRWY